MRADGKTTLRAVAIDLGGSAVWAILFAAAVGSGCWAMGVDPIVFREGSLTLRDGTRIKYVNDAEFESLVSKHQGHIAGSETRTGLAPALWLVAAAPYLGAGLWLAYRLRSRLRVWFRFDRRAVLLAVALWLATQASYLGYLVVTVRLGWEWPQLPIENAGAFGIATFAVMAVVFAPFVEEIFVRGRLWELVESFAGSRWALIVTSLGFAVAHFGLLPVLAPPYLILSFALGWLRRRTGALLAPTVLHILNNTTTVVMILVQLR